MIPLEAWELLSESYRCKHLQARRRGRIQGKEEPKTTLKPNIFEQLMYPPVKGPLRALQRKPYSILSYSHYTHSYTSSNILSYNHPTRG